MPQRTAIHQRSNLTVAQFKAAKAQNLGEKIAVRRFARFKLGDNLSSGVANREDGPEGGDVAGIAVKKPKSPNLNSGFAAANLDEESE